MNFLQELKCLFKRVRKLENNYNGISFSLGSITDKPTEFPPETVITEQIVIDYLFSLPGAGPNMILSINSTGDAFEWVSQ